VHLYDIHFRLQLLNELMKEEDPALIKNLKELHPSDFSKVPQEDKDNALIKADNDELKAHLLLIIEHNGTS
jgi:hypothetical protein